MTRRRRSPRPSSCSPDRVPDTGAQLDGGPGRAPDGVSPGKVSMGEVSTGRAGLACRVTVRLVDDGTRTPTSLPRQLEALALPERAGTHGPRLVLLEPDVRELSGALSGQG